MPHKTLISIGLLCLFVLSCVSSSTSTQSKNNTTPSAPPKETVRPLPLKGPRIQALTKKPTMTHRVLYLSAKIKLRDKKSVRTRITSFQTWRDTSRVKTMNMRHGNVWLNLTITTMPPGYIALKGAFRAGGYFFPINKKSNLLTTATPKWDRTFVHNSTDKKAGVTISILARLQSQSTQPGQKSYSFNVENIDLYRLMKRLAQFNNLKLSWSPAIPNRKGITLKLKAKKRITLVHTVCAKYNLVCKVLGNVLWAKAK